MSIIRCAISRGMHPAQSYCLGVVRGSLIGGIRSIQTESSKVASALPKTIFLAQIPFSECLHSSDDVNLPVFAPKIKAAYNLELMRLNQASLQNEFWVYKTLFATYKVGVQAISTSPQRLLMAFSVYGACCLRDVVHATLALPLFHPAPYMDHILTGGIAGVGLAGISWLWKASSILSLKSLTSHYTSIYNITQAMPQDVELERQGWIKSLANEIHELEKKIYKPHYSADVNELKVLRRLRDYLEYPDQFNGCLDLSWLGMEKLPDQFGSVGCLVHIKTLKISGNPLSQNPLSINRQLAKFSALGYLKIEYEPSIISLGPIGPASWCKRSSRL